MPTIVAALIAAIPATIAAFAAWRASQRTSSIIGKPGSNGNVVEMLEALRTWVINHDAKHTIYGCNHRYPLPPHLLNQDPE